MEGNNYVDEYSIHYLKKTDSSILHVLGEKGVGGKRVQDGVQDLVQFHPELRWKTALLPLSVRVRIFMILKSKAVIHHYLNKHLLHAHFKVLSTFVLFLQ